MRRPNDFYPTPSWATQELLKRIPFNVHEYRTVEPCSGAGDITKELGKRVTTCDIDPKWDVDMHLDMSTAEGWNQLQRNYSLHDWVITNPPFNCAIDFARYGLEHAQYGMALLLRLTFLEPVKDRADWLKQNPPHQLIVLPRISFTADGKHDSVTCAWMIWYKNPVTAHKFMGIEIVGKQTDV